MKKRGVAVISIIIFLVLISSAFALDGCYYYPKSSKSLYCQKITEEKALADYKIKALGETKQYTSFFNPGKDCSGIPTCKSLVV